MGGKPDKNTCAQQQVLLPLHQVYTPRAPTRANIVNQQVNNCLCAHFPIGICIRLDNMFA